MIKIKFTYWDGSAYVDKISSSDRAGKRYTETSAKEIAGELAWTYPGAKVSITRYEEYCVDETLFDSSSDDDEEEDAPKVRKRR